jgi:hypothetical protein
MSKNGKFQLNCESFSLIADNVMNFRTELTDNAAQIRFSEEQERKNKNASANHQRRPIFQRFKRGVNS